MREVTPESAVEYLRDAGHVPEGRSIVVRALGWGVSNIVMRVDAEGMAPYVLKQARERLRTRALWISRLDRIWTEKAAMELLATFLPEGTVPRVLFDDRDNYLFAMSLAPEDSVVWKEQLLAGNADPRVARRAGEILGTIHARTINHPALAGRLSDTLIFDQLRIDPFYRTIARTHPQIANHVDALTASLLNVADPCLVLADFSPKNILVHAHGLTLVDFETAHAGNPAYDLGFFLSHLLLKAFRASPREEPYLELMRTFWEAYFESSGVRSRDELVARSCGHLAACALARVDGTSPVDYLDEPARAAVRRFALHALEHPGIAWNDLLAIAAREMHV
jgi:5-methylthioribose kinase